MRVRGGGRSIFWMLLPIHLNPMEHARHRGHPAADVLREVALAGTYDCVSSLSVFLADVLQPVEEASMAPCLVEKFEEDNLRDAAGVLRANFGVSDKTLDDLCGGSDPANAGTWRDDLGEGIETEYAAGGVEGEV